MVPYLLRTDFHVVSFYLPSFSYVNPTPFWVPGRVASKACRGRRQLVPCKRRNSDAT